MTASGRLAQELCLRDGLTVSARAVTRGDEAAIWGFLTDLSVDSRRLRFFGVAIDLRDQAYRRLARCAEDRQINTFFAEVLPENNDMLAVFRDGFDAATVNAQGVTEVEFPTSSWRAAHARFER